MKYGLFSSMMVLTALFSFMDSVYAYNFSPPVVYLTSTGNSSTFLFTVSNPEDRIIPLDMSVYEVKKDLTGLPVEGEEIIDDFLIYPAQFLLKPKEVKSVQLRWVGDPELLNERTFTFFSREMPIPMDGSKSIAPQGVTARVNVLMNYAVRVYVSTTEAEPDIIIDSVEAKLSDVDGRSIQQLIITCLNKGDKHGKLVDAELQISSDIPSVYEIETGIENNATVTLSRMEVPGFATSIFAKSRRRYVIPWPEEIPFGPVKVTLTNEHH